MVKGKHVLREAELLVTPSYDCFEELPDETTTIKETFWKLPVTHNVMNFVAKHRDIESEFDLKSMNFDVKQGILQFSKEFDDPKEAENFESKLKLCLNSIVEDSIKISKGISQKIEEVLKERREEFQNKLVVVRYDPQCSALFLIGEQKEVTAKKQSLLTIIHNLQERLKKKTANLTILDKNKLLFLNFIDYSKKLMTEFPNVQVTGPEETSGRIRLIGTQESIKDVRIRILEDVRAITKTNVKMSKRQLGFLKRTQCKLVNDALKKDGTNAMLTIGSAETPRKAGVLEAKIITLKITDVNSIMKNIVLNMTSEKCVRIDDDTGPFLSKSKKLKDFQVEQFDKFGVMVEYETVDPRNIWIVSENSKTSNALEEVMTFTKLNAIHTNTFQTEESRARFLTSHLKDDVATLCEHLSEEGVQVNHLNSGSFMIKGTKAGIKQAIDSLLSLLEQVVSQFYKMKGPGVKKQLEMDATATMITGIEKEYKCIFERNARRGNLASDERLVTPKDDPLVNYDQLLPMDDKQIKTKSGQKISVVIGDLSQQKVRERLSDKYTLMKITHARLHM